jgi:hypothetical protein
MGKRSKIIQCTAGYPAAFDQLHLVSAHDLPAGHAVKPEDIAIKSPGDGLPPYKFDKIVGCTTVCDLKADDDLNFEVLNGVQLRKRPRVKLNLGTLAEKKDDDYDVYQEFGKVNSRQPGCLHDI